MASRGGADAGSRKRKNDAEHEHSGRAPVSAALAGLPHLPGAPAGQLGSPFLGHGGFGLPVSLPGHSSPAASLAHAQDPALLHLQHQQQLLHQQQQQQHQQLLHLPGASLQFMGSSTRLPPVTSASMTMPPMSVAAASGSGDASGVDGLSPDVLQFLRTHGRDVPIESMASIWKGNSGNAATGSPGFSVSSTPTRVSAHVPPPAAAAAVSASAAPVSGMSALLQAPPAHGGADVKPLSAEDMRRRVTAYIQSSMQGGLSPLADQEVTVINARVVQKSYGTEKRFFCPPPCISFSGHGWDRPELGTMHVFVGLDNNPDEFQEIEPENGVCTARSLYISDQDKRKSFSLRVKIFYSSGHDIGTFASRPIKVISKPSKKKQSVNNPEMCVENNTEISLFNRVRAQAGSTRYLQVADGELRAGTTSWDTFRIVRCSEAPSAQDRQVFNAQPDLIHYGMDVMLECDYGGFRSTKYTVRRVDKNVVKPAGNNDPVSQLQKVAFYVHGSDRLYLALTNDSISHVKARPSPGDPTNDMVSDGSTWTISSTDRAKYIFCDASRPGVPSNPVNPIPTVTSVKTLGRNVELYGEKFSTNLQVWFGTVPAKTVYRCEEMLMCKPPKIEDITGTSTPICDVLHIPLLLVRNDGVIYNIHKKYAYEPDPILAFQAKARSAANSKRTAGSSSAPGGASPAHTMSSVPEAALPRTSSSVMLHPSPLAVAAAAAAPAAAAAASAPPRFGAPPASISMAAAMPLPTSTFSTSGAPVLPTYDSIASSAPVMLGLPPTSSSAAAAALLSGAEAANLDGLADWDLLNFPTQDGL